MINIADLQPYQPSEDLKGKYMLFYGLPKVGKTSLAVQFPKSLLLAFEKGYNDLAGVLAADMLTWSDFKTILVQLRQPANKERYDSIIIDTADIAWSLCEKYICAQQGVTNIKDIPYGAGYALAKNEFSDAFREITMLGYGLIFIAHSEIKVEGKGDSAYEMYRPALNKRPYEIINGLVDLIGYIDIQFENGRPIRTLCTRGTPTFFAGTRFKHLPARISFDYNSLATEIVEALRKKSIEVGVSTSIDKDTVRSVVDKRPFQETVAEGKEVFGKIMERPELLSKATAASASVFGNSVKLSEITEDQQELFEILIVELKELLK